VAATSGASAWAVGSSLDGTTNRGRTFILRWMGTRWAGTTENTLGGLAAASAGDVWAVGSSSFSGGGVSQPLAVHCC
jgi:hypothetical protein